MEEKINPLVVKTNLLFSLVDVVETLLMDMSRDMKRQGRELRFDIKRNFNMAIRGVRGLKSVVKEINEKDQDVFGYDSDIIYALLMIIVDRTGDDDMKSFKLYNYIKAMPSMFHLTDEVDERMAFGHVLEGKEDGQWNER